MKDLFLRLEKLARDLHQAGAKKLAAEVAATAWRLFSQLTDEEIAELENRL